MTGRNNPFKACKIEETPDRHILGANLGAPSHTPRPSITEYSSSNISSPGQPKHKPQVTYHRVCCCQFEQFLHIRHGRPALLLKASLMVVPL